MLLAETLDLLRQCWKARPPGYDATTPLQERWLFPGRKPGKPITTRQLSRLFHEAADAAGIKKSVTLHALRHSFATHRGGAEDPTGSTLPGDSFPPPPATPSAGRHGGQHTALIPGLRVRHRTLARSQGHSGNGRIAPRRPNTRPKAIVQEQFSTWVIHGTWFSPPRPSQECDPHSVNSNGPRPNRQGWKSSQFSPPTSPVWGCFGSSRRIAIPRVSPRSHGLSVAFPRLQALRPSTKDT